MGSLVTGIGYIGSTLVERLLASGEDVVGLDNFFSTDPGAVHRLASHPRFTLVRGDVIDEESVARAFQSGVKIDTVYHLAAQASAHPSAAPTRYTEETNLIGPRVVMEGACDAGTARFIFGGSLQVYGREPSGRVDESAPYGPILDISHLSKVHVEKLMEMFALTRGLRCASARIGLVYGLSPVMKTHPLFMTAPNKFCLQAAREEPLRVDANAARLTSMVHVEDVARGLITLAAHTSEGFHAANLLGETSSVARVAESVRRLGAERGMEVQLIAPVTADAPAQARPSFVSALTTIGYTPSINLEQGLSEVLDHFAAAEGSWGGRS